jgi:SSS family solute:Na+ symporter
MLALAWILGLYLPYKLYGGISPMFERLTAEVPEMLTAPGLDAAGNRWTWGGYSSAIAISALGFSLWPHYFMKIYTARNIRTLKKTVVYYPTFQIFLVPIMFIGFAGVLAYPGVSPADTILPTIVTSIGLPAVVVGLFCAGALAASMSTGDAIIHAAGSILVKDFFRVLFRPDMSDRSERRWIRTVVVLVGAVAYYFAVMSSYSLVYLLLLSYGAIAQLFPLVMATLFWKRSNTAGVLSGLLVGCGITLIWNLSPQLQWQQIHPGIWGVAGNVVTLIVVSLATRPMDEDHVGKFLET